MPESSRNDFATDTLEALLSDMDPTLAAHCFGWCLNTAKAARNGKGDGEKFVASFRRALRLLPVIKRQQFANLLTEGTPIEFRLRDEELDCEVGRSSQAVRVLAKLTDAIECIDNAEADGDWSDREEAEFDAAFINFENECRRLRKSRAVRRKSRIGRASA